jgi:hypothetical protein
MTPAIPHSAGDGCTVADCSNSAGVRFPSCVSRSTWRGFAFDPGAHGILEHLMPRSGEQVRHRGLKEASSEAETRSRGYDETLERGGDSPEVSGPSNEAEARSGGAAPSSEAGVSQCDARPSSETEVRLRVTGDGGSVGRWGFWVMGFIRFGPAAGLGSDFVVMC